MTTTRRDFLSTAAASGAIAALGLTPLASAALRRRPQPVADAAVPRADRPLKILILCCTGFL